MAGRRFPAGPADHRRLPCEGSHPGDGVGDRARVASRHGPPAQRQGSPSALVVTPEAVTRRSSLVTRVSSPAMATRPVPPG